jgi:hypothetical protein
MIYQSLLHMRECAANPGYQSGAESACCSPDKQAGQFSRTAFA